MSLKETIHNLEVSAKELESDLEYQTMLIKAEFIHRVETIMKEKGMTIKDLSNMLELPLPYLENIFSENVKYDLDMMVSIALAIDMRLEIHFTTNC